MISIYTRPGANVKAVNYKAVQCDDFKTAIRYALEYQWSPITWKNNYRKKVNFISCEFCVLDIDGTLSYPQVCRLLQERKIKSVVLSSENHQREKDGVICDRLRIIMRWDKPIVEIDTYLFNYRCWNREFSGDKNNIDGGRHFKPCREVLGVFNGELLSVAIPAKPPTLNKDDFFKTLEFKKSGNLPPDLKAFVECGNLLTQGRQSSFFLAACTCRRLGMTKIEAAKLLKRAPINTTNFDFEKEFSHALNSAYNYK